MLIKEFRIILPLTVEEYQIAQLYSVAEASKHETGGGDGVEILKNEPFHDDVFRPDPPLLNGDPRYITGQYTHKCYHLYKKVPTIVRSLAPSSALVLTEHAWNAYPFCRTDLRAHGLSEAELKARQVIDIDIGAIDPSDTDYKPDEDPTQIRSEKAGRGPLKPNWWLENYCGPIMCAYKLVRCECKIFLLQSRLESMIQRQERRLFANFHRQVFCWMDRWYGMTLEDIRRLEEKTRQELAEQRAQGSLRGHTGEE